MKYMLLLVLGMFLGSITTTLSMSYSNSEAQYIIRKSGGIISYQPNETIYLVPKNITADVFRALHKLSSTIDQKGHKHTLETF